MSATTTPNYYEILGVDREASAEAIRTAWRNAVRIAHPDAGGSNGLFRLLSVAYETLSDPAKRSAYDATLSPSGPTRSSTNPGTASTDNATTRTDEDNEEWWVGDDEDWDGSDEEWDVEDEEWDVSDEPEADTHDVPTPSSTAATADFRRIWRLRVHHVIVLVLVAIYFAARPIATPATDHEINLWLMAMAGVIVVWRVAILCGIDKARKEAVYRSAGIESIDAMEGVEFEQRLARLFTDLGYEVETTVTTGDYGADLILAKDGACVIVQAKRSSRPVGVAAVQEAHTAIAHYGGNEAIVVTNNTFTHQAQVLAGEAGVALYDRQWLIASAAAAQDASGTRYTSKRRIERSALGYGAPVLAKAVAGLAVLPLLLLIWVLGSMIGGAAKLSGPGK